MPSKPPTRKGARPADQKPKSEIAPGVFVGGWKEALAFTGVRYCVLDEAPEDMPPATHIPIYDEASDGVLRSNLDRLADSVQKSRSEGQPVMIFCAMGVRRGALGGAWYLHRAEKIPLDEAYERVRHVRPKIETADQWVGDTSGLK